MWRGVKFWPFPLTLIVVLTTLSHYRADFWNRRPRYAYSHSATLLIGVIIADIQAGVNRGMMWVVFVCMVCWQVSDAREQRPRSREAACYAGPGDTADHCRPRHAVDTATDAERSTGTSRVRLLLSLSVCYIKFNDCLSVRVIDT